MPPNIVFIVGEPEYNSHISMPPVAEELQKKFGYETKVITSSIIPDEPDFLLSEFPGLEALADADLAVFFTRFRNISVEQFEIIKSYLESGRPVVGLRAANHAFKFPDDSPIQSWNEGFGRSIFGTPWRMHYGHESSTDVRVIPEMANHQILEGVENSFHVRSPLYYVMPLPGACKTLLEGTSIGPSDFEERVDNPVAWTNVSNEARVFYTSMGHPEDFENNSFKTLLFNGIQWALGK